ncbi:MAG: carboxypeptidase-like regulatory domain-containing protein [Chitinophagaceae bacterium]
MRKWLVLPVLFLFPAIVFSQLLKGKVLRENGNNASDVTVRFQNKANGVSTNADGTFKIKATKLPDTLVFSAVGFEPYKVVITEKNIKDPDFEVVLLNKRKTLDEVVVSSMGAAKEKKELTYSTKTVYPEGLRDRTTGMDVIPGTEVIVLKEGVDDKSSPITLRGIRYLPPGYTGYDKFFFADTTISPRDAALAKSRILTAGEVNDFNKWKMWEDYTENEFKSMSVFWGMRSTKRYSVQVTDKNHNAVINEPVYLINKDTKDTAWKAVTDNTGKAELWGSFFSDSLTAAKNKDNYIIADGKRNSISNPSEFASGVNLLVVNKSCQVSFDADIAFVVDATGSMGDEIEFLKLELEDVIRSTMEKYRSLTLRAASVFYRDKRDEYLTKKVSFSDDLLKTLNFIKLQSAGGGGDYPEAVDDAISVALDSIQWNKEARTRLLFLVLDAPPHNEAKERIQQLILKAAAMGIRIIPIACSGTDKSTEFLLRSMALATNGTYTFLTNHSGVGNSHIEPTTNKYEVELLNNLLQRVISQYLYAKDCSKKEEEQQEIKQPENILKVKIYPNPTSGQFVIESNKDIKEIYISDFTGKLLMKLAAADKKGRWQVDIGNYPSGAYLVKYITTDNKWGAEKVILLR